jgi:DNA-binding Lrp family transcriptional regulator
LSIYSSKTGACPLRRFRAAWADISERAIRYRIDRMRDEGVIQISAVVSPEALGYSIKADVWLEVESDA